MGKVMALPRGRRAGGRAAPPAEGGKGKQLKRVRASQRGVSRLVDDGVALLVHNSLLLKGTASRKLVMTWIFSNNNQLREYARLFIIGSCL